jgi:hypothetical protein
MYVSPVNGAVSANSIAGTKRAKLAAAMRIMFDPIGVFMLL